MPLETGEWVGDFVTANPTNGDAKKYGDDHFRIVKEWTQNSFAGWPGLILGTGTEAQGATENDFVLTMSPTPSSLTTGIVVFKATHANTGACTLQINALTAKTLKDMDGDALASGDITSGAMVAAYYDGTDFFLLTGNDRAARNGDTYTGTQDFTGATITVTTQSANDNSTKVASTAYTDTGLALKANIESPALTGIPTAPTASPGTSGDQIATVDYANALSFASALPSQTGNAGKLINTDGVTATWDTDINATVMSFADGTDPTKKASLLLSGITAGQNRVITVPDSDLTVLGIDTDSVVVTSQKIRDDRFTIVDSANITKQLALQLSGISPNTTRTITPVDEDIALFTPLGKLLSTHTASGAATFDIEPTFLAAYDRYLILIDNLTVATNAVPLLMRVKVGGAYVTTSTYSYRLADYTSVSGSSSAQLFASLGNSAQYYVALGIEVLNPLSTTYEKSFRITGHSVSALDQPSPVVGEGSTGALQGIRLYAGSGNISGTARVYGIRKT